MEQHRKAIRKMKLKSKQNKQQSRALRNSM